MSFPHVIPYLFKANGNIPNNQDLPLLLYPQVMPNSENLAELFRKAFHQHSWGGTWLNGVYHYHHYHSLAHEVLGVVAGSAELILGGPGGKEVTVKAGDMVIIPAGVGHYRKESSSDFKVMGAYPRGQEQYDTCTEADAVEEKKQNILRVPLPVADPFFGSNGPLLQHWQGNRREA